MDNTNAHKRQGDASYRRRIDFYCLITCTIPGLLEPRGRWQAFSWWSWHWMEFQPCIVGLSIVASTTKSQLQMAIEINPGDIGSHSISSVTWSFKNKIKKIQENFEKFWSSIFLSFSYLFFYFWSFKWLWFHKSNVFTISKKISMMR